VFCSRSSSHHTQNSSSAANIHNNFIFYLIFIQLKWLGIELISLGILKHFSVYRKLFVWFNVVILFLSHNSCFRRHLLWKDKILRNLIFWLNILNFGVCLCGVLYILKLNCKINLRKLRYIISAPSQAFKFIRA
jgi:hypothetical protein